MSRTAHLPSAVWGRWTRMADAGGSRGHDVRDLDLVGRGLLVIAVQVADLDRESSLRDQRPIPCCSADGWYRVCDRRQQCGRRRRTTRELSATMPAAAARVLVYSAPPAGRAARLWPARGRSPQTGWSSSSRVGSPPTRCPRRRPLSSSYTDRPVPLVSGPVRWRSMRAGSRLLSS
jgi:hypothetical protein